MRKYMKKEFIPKLKEPLEKKIEDSLKLIKAQLEKHRYGSFVACSFGKDSMTVLYMVRKFKPDIPVFFANTLVQHPDVYKFRDKILKKWKIKNYVESKPVKTFWEVLKEKGLDDKKKHKNACCYYLKERPSILAIREYGFTCQFDGITVPESRHRMLTICRYGVVQYHKRFNIIKVHPLAFWTPENVWDYIKQEGIPYCPIYDKGFDRSGCITCTSWMYWRKQMQKHYPQLYKRIMEEGFGQKVLI